MSAARLHVEVVCAGIGVHSGLPAVLTLRPAPAGSGRTFVRGSARIPATLEHVVDARLATTLGHEGVRVGMVEHLLAALVVRGIEDVDLVLEGDEVPILDGSAHGWLAHLAEGAPSPASHASAGTSDGLPSVRLDRLVRVETRGGSWAEAAPADDLSLDVSVTFAHPAIGAQRWSGGADRFEAELAGARTFGFLADAEALRAAGLARGARHDNALVFDADGPMTPLRWPDEPVRHKALDLLGDLALLGAPLCARVRVHHGGHALHHALVRALTEAMAVAHGGARRA